MFISPPLNKHILWVMGRTYTLCKQSQEQFHLQQLISSILLIAFLSHCMFLNTFALPSHFPACSFTHCSYFKLPLCTSKVAAVGPLAPLAHHVWATKRPFMPLWHPLQQTPLLRPLIWFGSSNWISLWNKHRSAHISKRTTTTTTTHQALTHREPPPPYHHLGPLIVYTPTLILGESR